MSQTQNAIGNTNAVVFDDDLSFLDELDGIIEEEAGAADEVDNLAVGVMGDDISEDLLMSVVDEVESDEEMAEIYAAQNVEVPEAVVVEGDEPVAILTAEEAVKAAVAVVPTKTKTPRASKSGKLSERIIGKLAADAVDYTTLTPAWGLKAEAEHLEDFSKIVDDMALYVGDKAANLFTFLRTGGGLNAVTLRGFEVLIRDNQLVGGDKGNIVTNLLSKPYSLGTARSQSNQLLQLFTDLEVGTRTARGVIVANPESVILERVKKLLGK